MMHASYYCTCLGHLEQRDINRNDPICVALPKMAKASKERTHYHWHCRAKFHQCRHGFMLCLHYGKNRAKLEHLKKAQYYFMFLKTH